MKINDFDYELFKAPSVEFRGLPFWSWNCRLKKDVIDKQLEIFKEMGFGGTVIHPREGLDTEYLSDEFMDMIRHTVKRSKELGLICWLYDDDRFPSGAADGIVTKDPRHRARQLLLTVSRPGEGYCDSREEFDAEIEKGNIPRGYWITTYAIRFENGQMRDYMQLEKGEAAPDGWQIRYGYIELQEPSPWFNGQSYVDTMDPEAVDEFIRVTHERYKRVLGDEFGKTASAIFTDEPRLGKQIPPKRSETDEDVYIPYTDHFAEEFKDEHGYDPLDIAPEFVWTRADGDMTGRLTYRDAAAECFARTFMDRICKWCSENGILMTGHILSESPISAQTTTVGEAMRQYRSMDIPGIDILADFKEFTSARQAASIAAQYGRVGVMSEEYGVTHWDCSFKTYKLQSDWQAALGITHRVPHLSHMTLEGEAKRDWPGSIFSQAPWYKEWKQLEDHNARVTTALTRGRRITRIGVIHPIESMWVSYGPEDTYKGVMELLDKGFTDFADNMLYNTLDFDYISESLLTEQKPDFKDARFALGKAEYEAIIVPSLITIRSTTLDALEAFAGNGGRIIFSGGIPRMVDGKPSMRAIQLANKSIIPSDLMRELEPFRDISVTRPDGTASDNILYQLRDDGGSKWLFLAHARLSESIHAERYKLKIRGEYALTLYDTMTGERREFPAHCENGYTEAELEIFSEDSLLFRLSDKADSEDHVSDVGYTPVQRVSTFDSVELTEPNVLLLDYARYKTDGEIKPLNHLLHIDNAVRREFGFTPHTGTDMQPWATEEKEYHKVTLYFDIDSDTDTPARLGIEHPELCRVFLNGTEADTAAVGTYVDDAIKVIDIPDIKKGKNELIIELRYDQKSYIENLYLLGDFDVEVNGNDKKLTAKSRDITLGDITAQGLPFYTGDLCFSFGFEAEADGEYTIKIDSFSAPIMAVYTDGKRTGTIAYAPHRASLGRLAKGRHEICVRLYGNRFNGFGTLHNSNDDYVWYGNSSFRTTGDEWTDSYCVRPVGIMSEIQIEKVSG